MSKETLQQANFRLPKELLDDLREVSKIEPGSQSEIVRKGISEKVKRLKTKHGLNEKVEAPVI